MDKQQEAAQPDSISTVGVQIKEYPPSEVYTSEPPPAYVRPRGSAVQIARIAAVTLIAVSFILGFFMVASAYVSASVSCYQDYPAPAQEQIEDRPSYQHLVDPIESEEADNKASESVRNTRHETQTESSQEQPIHLKLPLQLDFDELAGSMIEKNQRSRMNCVVEKRRAEEVMDHQPKTVRLPFGVNLTTDPRYEHITGERMAIFCESGNDQRHVPMEQEQQVPMMQIVPIQVHQVPAPHPNAIPHGPFHHPPPFHHGHPQAQVYQHVPLHQQPQPQPQQPYQPELPPQVLHAVQQQLAEQLAESHQHRRFMPQIQPQTINDGDQVIIQEEVIPVFQGQLRPEGRSMEHHPVEQHPVPADTVKPPPPPAFARLPVHDRPHFVQPRSVRSVDSVLRREKRVRRCACDCAC